ncbi:MAG TPA: ABC transporter permease subunit [Acidimicrobiales bacterium]|nr:ABC transporter permease subunit [Acidimicrobiales bacterium]
MSDARVGAEARILERGYRRYTGRREGEAHAVRSVIAHTLRRILGLRRPTRAKVLPAMSIAFAYLPAIVFVGVISLFGRFGGKSQARQIIPQYHDYYGFIISAIILFVAFVAPEALCPDRRSKVLSLYLASPLTRMTYLLAKAAAVAIVIAFVTVGPPLLLLVGLMMQSAGPDGPLEVLRVVIHIFESGMFLAVLYTCLSMAIASLTDRRAVAAAATLFVLVGSAVVTGTLIGGLGASDNLFGLNLASGPLATVTLIYGERIIGLDVDTWVLALSFTLWTVAAAAVAIVRYRRLQVTR